MAKTSAIFKGAYTKLLTSLGLGLEAGQKIKYTDGAAAGSVPVSDAGGILSLGTATSITAAGSDSQIQYNNGGVFGADPVFVFDDVNKRLGVGTAAPAAPLQVLVDTGATQVSHEMATNAFAYRTYSNTASTRSQFRGMRYRGTVASPTVLSSGDRTFSFQAYGYDGANAISTSSLDCYVDGAVSSGTVPMRLVFTTGTTTPLDRMVIKSDGKVGITQLTPGAALHVQSIDAAGIATIVQAQAAQSANLMEFQNSSGTARSFFRSDGTLSITGVDSSSRPCYYAIAGSDSSSFYLIRGRTAGDTADVFGLNNRGQVGFGVVPKADDWMMRVTNNGATPNTMTTLVLQKTAAQTGDAFRVVDSDLTTVRSSIGASGEALFSGMKLGIRTVTSAPTITAADWTLLCDATSAGFTVTLPAASTNTGRIFNIKKIDSTVNPVVIDGNASETIDGSLTYSINEQNRNIQLQCTGTAWVIL